jgi:hypothetical protein
MSSIDRYPELAQLCALVDEAGRTCELISHLNGDGTLASACARALWIAMVNPILTESRHCSFTRVTLFAARSPRHAHTAFANPQTSAALLAVADERSMEFVDAHFAMEEQLQDIIELARSQFRIVC